MYIKYHIHVYLIIPFVILSAQGTSPEKWTQNYLQIENQLKGELTIDELNCICV